VKKEFVFLEKAFYFTKKCQSAQLVVWTMDHSAQIFLNFEI
jgi:hypothetical protein